MTYTIRALISAGEAGEIIRERLGLAGIYSLANNRCGRHNYTIPYHRIGRRVYYDPSDIERLLAKHGKKSGLGRTSHLLQVDTSEDVWLMGPAISTEGKPIVEIVRGGGTEILTPDDAKRLADSILSLATISYPLTGPSCFLWGQGKNCDGMLSASAPSRRVEAS